MLATVSSCVVQDHVVLFVTARDRGLSGRACRPDDRRPARLEELRKE